jgi:hypothetical protein
MEDTKVIYLTSDFELVEANAETEATASAISLNPYVSWAKFVFTDDLPNANKQRIPQEEFPSIIKTGVHMPVKMPPGRINDDHTDAIPLGTIAQMRVEGNKVLGLAALWIKERPEDIEMLKNKESKPQLSWEVLYSGFEKDENTGVETLSGVIVRASTIVGLPAYRGRTPMLAIASESAEEKKKMEELQAEIAELKKTIEQLQASLAEKETTLAEKDSALASQTDELTQLRAYKEEKEKKEQEELKMAAIKTKFADAGIEKDETYFTEKRENFLKLEDPEIDFLLQELVSFKPKETSESSAKIPNLTSISQIPNDPVELGKLLREVSKIEKS